MGASYRVAILSLLSMPGLIAAEQNPGPPETLRAESIPPRTLESATGSAFAKRTTDWAGRKRQGAAITELLAGNIPDFLRTLRPVQLTHTAKDGTTVAGTVWVTPDYLAIGSDEDFLYIPLTLPSATAVANAWGFVLPTRKVVDAIYAQADYRFEPIPMTPGPKMRSSAYYIRHQELIDQQRAGVPPGTLVAGHKKDVVLTNRLAAKADRIAIYGWHRKKGDPIQPLSTVHGARYADYSHGTRLVWNQIWVEGGWRSVFEVLQDPRLAPLLTYEGVIRAPRKLMHQSGEPWPE